MAYHQIVNILSNITIPLAMAHFFVMLCLSAAEFATTGWKDVEFHDPFDKPHTQFFLSRHVGNVFFASLMAFFLALLLPIIWPVTIMVLVVTVPTVVIVFYRKREQKRLNVIKKLRGDDIGDLVKVDWAYLCVFIPVAIVALVLAEKAYPITMANDVKNPSIGAPAIPKITEIQQLRKQSHDLQKLASGEEPRCIWNVKTNGSVFLVYCSDYIADKYDNRQQADEHLIGLLSTTIENAKAALAEKESKPLYDEAVR